MKALILGIPGSGTSYFADLLSHLGYSDCAPTFSRVDYGYPTHESLLGRAVNRIAIGHSGQSWPVERWGDQYRPRNPFNDPELHHVADYFVAMQDMHFRRWYFKNPESLMFFDTVWKRHQFDHVIGVYRHADESVQTMHSNQVRGARRRSWLKWSRRLIKHSTILVRFPDDAGRLCAALGETLPEKFSTVPGFPTHKHLNPPRDWATEVWGQLEEHRWNTLATRT